MVKQRGGENREGGEARGLWAGYRRRLKGERVKIGVAWESGDEGGGGGEERYARRDGFDRL